MQKEESLNIPRVNRLVAGVFSTTVAAGAHAVIVNIGALKDNTLYESSTGAFSSGAGPTFFVGRTATGAIRRGLIAFDIAGSLPGGAIVTSATLTLNMSSTIAAATNVSLHRTLQDWGEGTSNAGVSGGGGAPSSAGDATWIHTFFDTGFWSTAGGSFAATSSATTSVAAIGNYSWSSAALTSDVQNMLDNPGANFGWTMVGDESAAATAKRFETRESLAANLRPVLVVEYTAVPEPASLAALGAGLLLLRRRVCRPTS